MPQAKAGELLGISQPKVSALLNGNLDGFSTDRLFRFLIRLGWDVQIRPSKTKKISAGRIQVTSPSPPRANP